MAELSTGLTGIKHEQEYMEVRERIHRMSKNNVILLLSTPFITPHYVQSMITLTQGWCGGLCSRHSFLSV